MTNKLVKAGPGRVSFPSLRRPGKAPELAMGYSISAPLALEYRDLYREFFWHTTVLWLVGHNPQMLLTDQRTDEQKIDYVFREAIRRRVDAFFDEIVLDDSLHFSSGGTVTGRWSGRASLQPQGEFILPRPRLEDLYRKR